MGEIDNLLCDVRKSFRILALFTDRICALVTYIADKLGVTYQSDHQIWGSPPVNKAKNTENHKGKSDVFDWFPMYYHAFVYDGSKPAITLTVILQCDTGYWDVFNSQDDFGAGVDGNGASPEIKDYADTTVSKSRLVFGICAKPNADLAELFNNHTDNWASPKNPAMSGEFYLPLSEGSKQKACFKVFDLAEFGDKEATDKALQEFIAYATKNGFDLKWQNDE